MISFYFPRWLFPNNLGDSVMTTFIPNVIKEIKKDDIEVITDFELGELFKKNKNVKNVRLPNKNEILNHSYWKSFAFERKVVSVYPEWHPKLWNTWNENFEYFSNHPSINLITLNYCLQLGIPLNLKEDLYFPIINCENKNKENAIGIVPDTKLAGRLSPHPGCDGVGYRLGGSNGFHYWRKITEKIKNCFPEIKIYEFSRSFLGLGDIHVSKLPLLDLASLISSLKLGILSDGGLHHVFNSVKTKVFLLSGQKVNKPEFFKTSNSFYDSSLYNDCTSCGVSSIKKDWSDLNCHKKCETVDIEKLSDSIIECINIL